jgi:butyrate kinase
MRESDKNNFIFVVNTGSTSTKLAFFSNTELVASATIRHRQEELDKFGNIWEQFDFRSGIASNWLSNLEQPPSAVVSVGGLLRPLPGGTYRVNDRMVADSKDNLQGEHVSNLACAIAKSVADEYDCTAYVVDPVSVDEFEPLARYSGHPQIARKSLSHALNIHSVSRLAAAKLGKSVPESNFVIAHLGGGISVAPVRRGKIIDANDASSDGPFTPERTGGLPLQQFIGMCFSGDFAEEEVRRMVMGKGGLAAYLGTNSAREVEELIEKGDEEACQVYHAMAYQIAKEIGAMATVLKGELDGIVLTGGLASSRMLVNWIKERVSFIGPVYVFPGEDEMKSLALGALRVLRGEEESMEY